MALEPCQDGCLNHNIGAAMAPTAGDDPCNSAGNGYFCAGSYWSVDAGVIGDCAQLWLRTGDDCNVDQWLEINVAEIRVENVAPVDGVDCCPPGTIWRNTTVDSYYISINDGGNCRWCQICLPHNLTATAIPTGADCGPLTGYDVGSIWRIPAGTLQAGQSFDIVYHLVNNNPCQWCRMCGSGGWTAGNNAIPEAFAANVIFQPTLNVLGFDLQGEFNLGTGTGTLLVDGRFLDHYTAQIRTDVAIPFAIVEVGTRLNGVISFFPITQSFHGVGPNQTMNVSGSSQPYYASAGDLVDYVIRVTPFGAAPNLTLDSFVINHADVSVPTG